MNGAHEQHVRVVVAMGQCLSWAVGFLVPSLWEAEVAISATALLIAALILFLLTSDQRASKPTTAAAGDHDSPVSSTPHSSTAAATRRHREDAGRGRRGARGKAASEITCAPGAGCYIIKVTTNVPIATPIMSCSSAHHVCARSQLELLSAKYLIGANLDGSSDPFAVISCGEQKRFRCIWLLRTSPLHVRMIIVAELCAFLQFHGAQPEKPSVGRGVQLPGRPTPGRGKQRHLFHSSLHLKFSNAVST